MSWQAVGIFQISQVPIFTPVVEGRLFRVRSVEAVEFQVVLKQAQIILQQVELWQAQRLAVGPDFVVILLPQPDFFEQRRLSVQLDQFLRSSTSRNVLIEVNAQYV